jgi:hypothetical protein
MDYSALHLIEEAIIEAKRSVWRKTMYHHNVAISKWVIHIYKSYDENK